MISLDNISARVYSFVFISTSLPEFFSFNEPESLFIVYSSLYYPPPSSAPAIPNPNCSSHPIRVIILIFSSPSSASASFLFSSFLDILHSPPLPPIPFPRPPLLSSSASPRIHPFPSGSPPPFLHPPSSDLLTCAGNITSQSSLVESHHAAFLRLNKKGAYSTCVPQALQSLSDGVIALTVGGMIEGFYRCSGSLFLCYWHLEPDSIGQTVEASTDESRALLWPPPPLMQIEILKSFRLIESPVHKE